MTFKLYSLTGGTFEGYEPEFKALFLQLPGGPEAENQISGGDCWGYKSTEHFPGGWFHYFEHPCHPQTNAPWHYHIPVDPALLTAALMAPRTNDELVAEILRPSAIAGPALVDSLKEVIREEIRNALAPTPIDLPAAAVEPIA
jgi:hypothetical protein